jgi:queuosine biosynthesis protein QueD
MYNVTKEFKFEAAHRLHKLPSTHACSNLHGHSYVVHVSIDGEELNDVGFVIDFGELKFFQNWLDEHFDHALILCMTDPLIDCLHASKVNTKMYIMDNISSAENMAKLFAEVIHNEIKNKVNIESLSVSVWETAKNCATYTMVPK